MVMRKTIQALSAYSPPLEGRSQSDCLLLDFNERTTAIAPSIEKALIDYIGSGCLQRYPEYGSFTERLAARVGVRPQELLITNGSDQGIDLLFRAAAEPGDEAVVPVPTFPMLVHSADINGLRVHKPVYTDSCEYPFDQVVEAVNEKTKVIVVCSPNNPTGTLTPRSQIIELARRAPDSLILVDECYYEYSKQTVADLINTHRNLCITRTFSKTWGLPSLRLGYIVANAESIGELAKLRGPYDVNKLAVVAAKAALDDPSYMEDFVEEVLQKSRPALERFFESKGIRFWPSEANFLLAHFPDARGVEKKLREHKILVRPRSGPSIDNTLRITLGTWEQTQRLIQALEDIL